MIFPNKSKITGVLFDLGSTLIEYENIPWDEMNLISLRAGYEALRDDGNSLPAYDEFTKEYIRIRQKNREFSARTLREWVVTDAIGELLESTGAENNAGQTTRFFKAYYNVVADQLTIFNDTDYVLTELKKAGLKIGLVSNTIFPESYHKLDLERFGIIDYFDFTLFSSSFGYRKPHPLIYKRAVELSGLRPAELIFVGDRYNEDYKGPRDSNIFSILKFRDGNQYPEAFPDDIVMIKSLNELLAFLG
ncbi:MAG: hypothetical protein DRP51_04150 [Candidatus Zixiibacteriota bacterium]|nr:MAG: hypothetical protein DRP51_04150 [candidate division Zixibacteria bacterium]